MGHCCEDIGLYISPEEMKLTYERWVKGLNNSPSIKMSENSGNKSERNYGEIYLLYPMLIFTKQDYTHPEKPKEKKVGKVYHYTCVHYDKKKRECGIYDIRPYMCRSYPNNKFCNNPKCQWRKQVVGREKWAKEQKVLSKKGKPINKAKDVIDVSN
jgi:Fe-S-cluster containining protein